MSRQDKTTKMAALTVAVVCSGLVVACSQEQPPPTATATPTAAAPQTKATAAKPVVAPVDSAKPAVTAGESGATAPTHMYVGVKKCSKCHKSEKKGDQFGHWQKSAHSKAFKTLLTAKAKEAGQKVGVADPSTDPKCLKCHVTAYGVDAKWIGEGFDPKDGIQCESCHGPGGDYTKQRIMKDEALAKANGLILPEEKVCLRCHNDESPFFKEFVFEKFFDKIKHPRPKK